MLNESLNGQSLEQKKMSKKDSFKNHINWSKNFYSEYALKEFNNAT